MVCENWSAKLVHGLVTISFSKFDSGKGRDPGNEIGTGSFGCLMTSPLADGVVHRLVVKKPLRVTQSADATDTKEGRAA